MTAYDVDVAELAAVIASMESCGRALADLAADVEAAGQRLHLGWTGRSSRAHQASHARWRASFTEMSTALTGLRGVGSAARDNYTAAVEANLVLWRRLASA